MELEAQEGMEQDDLRVLAMLTVWLEVHSHWVNACHRTFPPWMASGNLRRGPGLQGISGHHVARDPLGIQFLRPPGFRSSVTPMEPVNRPFPIRLARRTLLCAATGVLVGGLSLGWMPRNLFLGAGVGLVYVIPTELGNHLFRSWTFQVDRNWGPAWAGRFFVLKLLVVWSMAMAVILPAIHWGLGLPVLGSFASALPHMAFSLIWTAVLLLSETVTQVYTAGLSLAQSEARAEFLALKAQLQPHTLFNALNGICGLIRDDPRGAEEATRRLASLMRHVLMGIEQRHWSLKEEFSLVEALLGLEALRFGNRLSTTLYLDPAMAEEPVPPLILLPLVENSLRHGFRSKVGLCSLQLRAQDGRIIMEDDGCGMSPDAKDGIGLRTVRERLRAEGAGLCVLPTVQGCRLQVDLR